jgi:hypothetical protein
MLTTKKFNSHYLLAGLCALITLLPVLNYSLTVSGEMLLTLSAWFVSNLFISTALYIYSRWNHAAIAHA